MSELAEVRSIIASEYGLDDEAMTFVVGETVAELEASATALARMIGENESQGSPPAAPADLFSGAAAAKAQRNRSFLDALTGRGSRRDEAGRFASSGSFDGGARANVPTRPPETHDQWLADVLRHRRADAGASF